LFNASIGSDKMIRCADHILNRDIFTLHLARTNCTVLFLQIYKVLVRYALRGLCPLERGLTSRGCWSKVMLCDYDKDISRYGQGDKICASGRPSWYTRCCCPERHGTSPCPNVKQARSRWGTCMCSVILPYQKSPISHQRARAARISPRMGHVFGLRGRHMGRADIRGAPLSGKEYSTPIGWALYVRAQHGRVHTYSTATCGWA